MFDDEPRFRPPAEADSLLLGIATGCPWNRCAFCAMYRDQAYRVKTSDEIRRTIAKAARQAPDTARIFLADGNVMALPFSLLKEILTELNQAFPRLARVNLYANGRSILAKSAAELGELRQLKLHTLYMGLESGSELVLQGCNKGETAAGMIKAVRLAQDCGLRVSVMILIGLAGRARSLEHAVATAEALNRMQPRLLSALRCIPIPGTPWDQAIGDGRIAMLTETEAVRELREIVARLDLTQTVFRANHSSNILPLEGRLPKDIPRLLAELDALLDSGELDAASPGRLPQYL